MKQIALDNIAKEPPQKTEQEKTETVSQRIDQDYTYGHDQIEDNDKLGYQKIVFHLRSQSDLHGIDNYLSYSVHKETPRNFMGSAYGGGEILKLSKIRKEDIENLFERLMVQKKNDLQVPYKYFTKEEAKIKFDYHHLYYDFRLIPADRYIVVISDRAVEKLKEKGFHFPQWYKKYRQLSENEATEEQFNKARQRLELVEEGENIAQDIRRLFKIKEFMEEMNDHSNYFSKSPQELGENIEQLGKELYKIYKEDLKICRELGQGSCNDFWYTLDRLGLERI